MTAELRLCWDQEVPPSLQEAPRIYRRAAIRLAHESDSPLLPVLCLYQHATELMIRRMVVLCAFVVGRPLISIERTHLMLHREPSRIGFMWQDLRLLLREAAAQLPLPDAEIRQTTNTVLQLAAVGPQSPPQLSAVERAAFLQSMEALGEWMDQLMGRVERLARSQEGYARLLTAESILLGDYW
jgi:hypothetical protein